MKILALLFSLFCSAASAQTVYFSTPPFTLLNFTLIDATQIMADYNRLVSDGNRTYNAFQAAVTAASNVQNQIPAGAIVPFNLAACPAGWILADGTNGTPPLVGRFVQSSAGSPAIGTVQADQLLDHQHTISPVTTTSNIPTGVTSTFAFLTFDGMPVYGGSGGLSNIGNICAACLFAPLTGAETRPGNVALNFCQRVPGPPPGCIGTGLKFNVACNSQYLELGGSVL